MLRDTLVKWLDEPNLKQWLQMVLSLSLQFLHKLNLFPFFFICVLIVVTIFLMIFTIHYIVQTAGNIPVKYSPADTSLSTLLSTVLEVLFSLKLSYFTHF